jgi:hypothetical protein
LGLREELAAFDPNLAVFWMKSTIELIASCEVGLFVVSKGKDELQPLGYALLCPCNSPKAD